MKARLSWICHGPTRANRRGCFPIDEPLEVKVLQRSELPSPRFGTIDRVWTSPALRARQTASVFGLDAVADAALRECDYGNWRGLSLAELHERDAESLALWMMDMSAAPHGGETLSEVATRVVEWMTTHVEDAGHTVAITHASVIRIAVAHVLQAPPAAFWSIDVEPFGIVEMTSDGRRWQLRFPRTAT
ncbi:MAG: histidine phosphatase family protein [Rhizobium sp.]|nr:MAG: histidine phosphatase family protein [Rhizobium sp.]